MLDVLYLPQPLQHIAPMCVLTSHETLQTNLARALIQFSLRQSGTVNSLNMNCLYKQHPAAELQVSCVPGIWVVRWQYAVLKHITLGLSKIRIMSVKADQLVHALGSYVTSCAPAATSLMSVVLHVLWPSAWCEPQSRGSERGEKMFLFTNNLSSPLLPQDLYRTTLTKQTKWQKCDLGMSTSWMFGWKNGSWSTWTTHGECSLYLILLLLLSVPKWWSDCFLKMTQLTISPGFYEVTCLADEMLIDCICFVLVIDTCGCPV